MRKIIVGKIMDICPVTKLAQALIKLPSITPQDAGCQPLLIKHLQEVNFSIETLHYDNVRNFWAWHGIGAPCLVFAGHTDVVSPGCSNLWAKKPFSAEIENGVLYGRGAADMKGALAAMVMAAKRFVTKYPRHPGRLAFLITADEEGSAINGTVKVVQELLQRKEHIDYCLVGEPSSEQRLGDVIKNGRRGSLTGHLVVQGIQGHVAYPQLARNPIHLSLQALQELATTIWDHGTSLFQPSNLQIIELHAGHGSSNMIPHELNVKFNLRYNPAISEDHIEQKVSSIFNRYQLNYALQWISSARPFVTDSGALLTVVGDAIEQYMQIRPTLSTTGGTSDGRFIAQMGAEIVEFGLINSTIHQINECTSVQDLQLLSCMYQQIMTSILLDIID